MRTVRVTRKRLYSKKRKRGRVPGTIKVGQESLEAQDARKVTE
jgi:hypothetical protein